jgi:outer membrane protein TolC
VTAQVSALNARRTVLQVQVSRQSAAVALIQGLGGGWQAEWMATPTSRTGS